MPSLRDALISFKSTDNGKRVFQKIQERKVDESITKPVSVDGSVKVDTLLGLVGGCPDRLKRNGSVKGACPVELYLLSNFPESKHSLNRRSNCDRLQ